jgi:preprotein translocase subunit SecG
MSLLINLLSFVLVVVCLFLGLLILVQLPKKEAGMGTAFGGDAAVAMFGAGSGNALSNLTKYAAGAFLILSLVLASLNANASKNRAEGVKKLAEQSAAAAPAVPAVNPAMSLTTPAATNAVTPGK